MPALESLLATPAPVQAPIAPTVAPAAPIPPSAPAPILAAGTITEIPTPESGDFITIKGGPPVPESAASLPQAAKPDPLAVMQETNLRLLEAIQNLQKSFSERSAGELPVKTPPPVAASATTPVQSDEFGFKFSSDDLLDAESLSRTATAQFKAWQTAQTKPNGQTAFSPEQLAKTVTTIIEQRENAARETQAKTEIDALVSAGNDADLVRAAVVYGLSGGAQNVGQAWSLFQKKFPALFASGKAEQIIGDAIGNRVDVPKDLGTSAKQLDANALRQTMARVTSRKFASDFLN